MKRYEIDENDDALEPGEVKRKKLLLMNVLAILQRYTDASHTMTVAQIRDCLREEYGMEADRKAIKKNLLDLIAFGYELGYSTKTRVQNGKRERILTDWYILREFTDAELRLLVDSLLFSKHIPHGQCRELIEKVEGLSSQYFSQKVRHVRNMPENLPRNPELFLTVELLDEAIGLGRQVEFEYCDFGTDKRLHPRKNAKGEPKKYTVNPYQMVATNGRYYLIGNFDFYDNVGHYRVDRIKHVRLLDTPAKRAECVRGLEHGLELPTHMAEHIYMFSGECGTVLFRAQKSIVGDILDWFGKDVRFFDETDGEISVSVRVNYRAMKYWAMQYAYYVTVTSPPRLVEELRGELSAAAARYRQDV